MTPSQHIDEQISLSKDWRGDLMTKIRSVIKSSDPQLEEGWKWSTGVWLYKGKTVVAFSSFKDHVKVNFFKGAQLKDTHKLINNGFTSKQHRSIDFAEGDKLDENKLKDLIKEAIELEK